MVKISGNNLVAKIMALILALVLWVYVSNEQNPPVESSLTAPLEIRNVVAPLVLLDAPKSVKVKVRGGRSVIAALSPQDVKLYIDLGGLQEGLHSAKVYAQLPAGLELVEVSPDKVQVRLDTMVSRKLPVEIRLTGTAATGTAVAKVTASPEQVTVEGPRSLVDAIGKMRLSIDLAGKNADFAVVVAPVPIDNDGAEIGGGLTVRPDRVNISATLVRGLSQKTVDVRPIVYGELAAGTMLKSVTANPAKIEISGDAQILDKIEFLYTEPVNVAGIAKDTAKEAKLQPKEGVLVSQNMVMVQITIGASR